MFMNFSTWFRENAEPQLETLMKLMSMKRLLSEGSLGEFERIINNDFDLVIKSFADQISNSSNAEIIRQLSLYRGSGPSTVIGLQDNLNIPAGTPESVKNQMLADEAKEACEKYKHGLIDFNFAETLYEAAKRNNALFQGAIAEPIVMTGDENVKMPAGYQGVKSSPLYSAYRRGAFNISMMELILCSNKGKQCNIRALTEKFKGIMKMSMLANIKLKEQGPKGQRGIGGSEDPYSTIGDKYSSEKMRSSPISDLSNGIQAKLEKSKMLQTLILDSKKKNIQDFIQLVGSTLSKDITEKEREIPGSIGYEAKNLKARLEEDGDEEINMEKAIGAEALANELLSFVKSMPQMTNKVSLALREMLSEKFKNIKVKLKNIDDTTKEEEYFADANRATKLLTSINDMFIPLIDDIVRRMDKVRNNEIDVDRGEIADIYGKIWDGLKTVKTYDINPKPRSSKKKEEV